MSIYTEDYQDSIEVRAKIMTKKRCCILAIITDDAEQKAEFISYLKCVILCKDTWWLYTGGPADQMSDFGTEAFFSYSLVPAEQL